MNFVNLLFRLFYWFDMRSIEVQIDGYDRVLDATSDTDLYFETVERRRMEKALLAKARANFTSTFQPGKRFVWKDA